MFTIPFFFKFLWLTLCFCFTCIFIDFYDIRFTKANTEELHTFNASKSSKSLPIEIRIEMFNVIIL